jgi:hypothetical protein
VGDRQFAVSEINCIKKFEFGAGCFFGIIREMIINN